MKKRQAVADLPSFRRDIKEYAFSFGWGEKVAPRLGAS